MTGHLTAIVEREGDGYSDDVGTITIPVPDHRELRTGTLMPITRQSSLPRPVFEV